MSYARSCECGSCCLQTRNSRDDSHRSKPESTKQMKFTASGWRVAADPSRLARGQCAGGPTPGVAPSPGCRIREHGWLQADRARSDQHRTTRTIAVVQVAPE